MSDAVAAPDPNADGGSDEAPAGRVALIRDRIFDAIVEHRLPPGTKLSEVRVGTAFAVSRTVARAALQALAHDGIVAVEHNRGAFVARPGADEARQVFAARRLIEPALASKAAGRCTPAALAGLDEHLAAEDAALRHGDRGTAIRLSGTFHLRIAMLAGNAVLTRFLRELVAQTSLVIALYGRSRTSACGLAEHRTIVASLARGDGGAAATAMQQHLDDIEADLDLTTRTAGRVNLTEVLQAAAAR